MTYSQKCANMHLLVYLYTLTQLFLPLDCCTVYVLEHIDTQDHKQTDTLMHTHTHYTHIHTHSRRQEQRPGFCHWSLLCSSRVEAQLLVLRVSIIHYQSPGWVSSGSGQLNKTRHPTIPHRMSQRQQGTRTTHRFLGERTQKLLIYGQILHNPRQALTIKGATSGLIPELSKASASADLWRRPPVIPGCMKTSHGLVGT